MVPFMLLRGKSLPQAPPTDEAWMSDVCRVCSQAHITCKALLAVVFVAFWLLRVCSEAEERPGMDSHRALLEIYVGSSGQLRDEVHSTLMIDR